MGKRIKIVLVLVISYLISTLIANIFFIGKYPVSNKVSLSTLLALLIKVNSDKIPPAPTSIPQLPIKEELVNALPSIISPVNQKKKATPEPLPTIVKITTEPLPTVKPKSNQTVVPPTQPPHATPYIEPTASPAIPYPTFSNNTYGTIEVLSAPTDRPADKHPDINLAIRGYAPTNGTTSLLDLGGDTDLKAPQFTTLLSNNPFPPIVKLYKVYDWNWSTNSRGGLITYPDATMFGIAVTPGEPLRVLKSQYDIGSNYQVMVLYATREAITMKYSREDNVVIGYTVHVEDIWVDPNLVALYENLNASGRSTLPALYGGDVYGIARSNEAKFVMRDSGAFMDIRSRKDWWH